ncbi:CAF17-like 4Fe-4S cluster assembly/insertion protein YgfZ [Acinetobacter radioresistens]|uniref:CAF17-like 4Fe-4S cluster assembly/insertion protein YgfZ n=1 Tax=Acinetobacter radioresistens TaxID=40216 RepID=UPI000DAE3988|nr:folate-binding Fe/S cluster repair protein [Acinetobacter radioresistens]AWV87180.1 folate-binding Fe/S cluster repair protein [Acinetobacter radioresistens]MCK4090134.1 folate-binding Fe/S cluster repair protein [Acinetobacter radioresistens]MCX0328210.1 folate-binding Fe/S cluster repair protein [Acinetobacter radioresistens]HCK63892.1 folate-binding Fe/S cluster repair protein [Acinetobacter radioresistens]
MTSLAFLCFSLKGVDAQKFLQGQVTADVERLDSNYRYTAICDLKGRIHFGLWLSRQDAENFSIVVTQDQSEEFAKHIRKYGAFSKMAFEDIGAVFPSMDNALPRFSSEDTDLNAWQLQAIEQGQAWITSLTEHEFQPQELRLHQRGGVHYDKGCYLGQEIVARLWFKAKPKHWLHLVQGSGTAPAPATLLHDDVEVVNSIAVEDGYKALVVAKPVALDTLGLTLLELPESLRGDVARPK